MSTMATIRGGDDPILETEEEYKDGMCDGFLIETNDSTAGKGFIRLCLTQGMECKRASIILTREEVTMLYKELNAALDSYEDS